MQSVDLIEINAYGTSKNLVNEEQNIKCNNIIKRQKQSLTLMILLKKIQKNNPNCPKFPDHSYRILKAGDCRSEKTNLLFNLISQQADISKSQLYAKDPNEAKYQFLLLNRKVEP